jgi:hypothetical protein
MLAVLRALQAQPNGHESLADVLAAAAMAPVDKNGQTVLTFMGKHGVVLRPHEAILASLLTPHRQMSLPTCSIDALINAETFNHPERLAKTYLDLLRTAPEDTVPFGTAGISLLARQVYPGNAASPPSILVTPTAVDFPQEGKASLPSSNPVCIFGLGDTNHPYATKKIDWKAEEIDTVVDATTSSPVQLKLPIRNLADLFFANFMENIYHDTDQREVFIQVADRYFGIPGSNVQQPIIKASPLDHATVAIGFTRDDIQLLITKAKILREAGQSKLLVTIFSQPLPQTTSLQVLDPFNGHLENIDVSVFASLDVTAMNFPGGIQIVGDRNWVNNRGEAHFLGIRRDGYNIFTFITVVRDEDPIAGEESWQGWIALSPME